MGARPKWWPAREPDRPIRWVHVVEVRDIASVLRGGELVLIEGRMFHGVEAADRLLIVELSERGVAAMVLELGANFHSVPRYLIDECPKRDLTLVALHLPVAFTDVTEAIHSQIVSQKITLLDQAHELQLHLTNLVSRAEASPKSSTLSPPRSAIRSSTSEPTEDSSTGH